MSESQSEPEEHDDGIERLPWRWQRIKMAAGDDALADAARRDLASEAEHSHLRRMNGA